MMVLTLVSGKSWAQELLAEKQMQTESSESPRKTASHDVTLSSLHFVMEKKLGPDLLADQKEFWTRPFRPRATDVNWLIPLAATTSLMIGSDNSIEARLPSGATFIKRSQTLSNIGAASLVAASGGIYFWGGLEHNSHAQETGILSGEALLDSLAVGSALQLFSGRQRPTQGTGKGKFWQGGNSFPSEHAAMAWSVASILAHEYPGPMTEFLAYGAASAISVARVTGRDHFASDVLVGGVLGWYLGRQTYHAHHDPQLDGPGWDGSSFEEGRENLPANMGSPYVPLDSWVYPAIERLAALGYVQTAFLGIHPWTRMECARLLQEAAEKIGGENPGSDSHKNDAHQYEASRLNAVLREEFADESARWNGAANLSASVDSAYTGFTAISGTPLRDGYHFGQTIINDYGRPYAEGFNAIDGFTSHAVAGPLSISVQGEYQHAPAVLSDAPSVLAAIAATDGTLPLANGTATINRFRLLESSIGLTFNNIELSFGQQSLWLGPSQAGPFLFSNNAEPMTMLRIDSVAPYRIPLLSYFLGPVRSQLFLGRLSGQHWEESPALYGPNLTSQPFVHGSSVSFHPTSNLEFGFGFTAQFGGEGNPFTWRNFLRTFYSHRADPLNNPAKRLSEFNFNYRVPGLRDWLEMYVDSMVIDEYTPIGSTRPAINPGIYLPRLPKMHKIDLRLEGITTDLNWPSHFGPGAFYFDVRYRSGYTNNGSIIGSWIGRQGRGEEGWLTYWFSPRTFIQVEYRQSSADQQFLQGGRQQDFILRGTVMLARDWRVSGFLQHEGWQFPVLSPAAKSDVVASVQLTFLPRWTAGPHSSR
ncbi:MAG: capsule assembly Wzi family protein [Candidatus Sulfotelmatobacter sp.]